MSAVLEGALLTYGGHTYLSYCDEMCHWRRTGMEPGYLPWTDEHGARRLTVIGCGHTAIQYDRPGVGPQ